MGNFQDTIAKYGLPAVLMIVLGLVGVAMYVAFKDKPQLKTAGIGIAITGLFIGLATIGYTWSQDRKAATNGTPPPTTNGSNGSGGSEGEDSLPGGV